MESLSKLVSPDDVDDDDENDSFFSSDTLSSAEETDFSDIVSAFWLMDSDFFML